MSPTSILAWPLERLSAAEAQPASCEMEVVELFDELRDRLMRYLLAMGLPAHDGEEIVQESFLLLFLHLRKGKPRNNLRGWIFRVAHNLGLKRRTANQIMLHRVVEFDDTLPEQSARANPNPEEEFGNRQRQERLLAVVWAMPERDLSCFLLRAEGLRYREIASVLGISIGSVAASVARALQRLERADRSL